MDEYQLSQNSWPANYGSIIGRRNYNIELKPPLYLAWRARVTNFYLNISISNGIIYSPSSKDGIVAIDIPTGKVIWENAGIRRPFEGIRCIGDSLFTRRDGNSLNGQIKINLISFDAKTGKLDNSWDGASGIHIDETPEFLQKDDVDRKLICSNYGIDLTTKKRIEIPGKLNGFTYPPYTFRYSEYGSKETTCTHIFTGDILWKSKGECAFCADPLGVLLRDATTKFDSNGELLRVISRDLLTGRELWARDIASVSSNFYPIATNDAIFFHSGAEDHFYAVDRVSGNILWKKRTEGIYVCRMVATSDMIWYTAEINASAGMKKKCLFARYRSNGEIAYKLSGYTGAIYCVDDAILVQSVSSIVCLRSKLS